MRRACTAAAILATAGCAVPAPAATAPCASPTAPERTASGAHSPPPTELTTAPAAVDPSRIVWDVAVTRQSGGSEVFPLSVESARLPIGLPCGVGAVQQDETKPAYHAIRALNCAVGGATFSALSFCAVQDGRLVSHQAFMTVREAGASTETSFSMMCRVP